MKTENKIFNFTRTISFKLILVGFMSLILLIPTAWIKSILSERQARNQEVTAEISSVWGGEQTIAGPVLSIPYHKSIPSDDKTFLKTGVAYFLPDKLEIDATVYPSTRHRGIFRVVVYNAEIHISGTFVVPDVTQLGIHKSEAEYENARLMVGIPDMRGIQKEVLIIINDQPLQVIPGSPDKEIIPGGFHVKPVHIEHSMNGEMNFKIELSLNGSCSLGFYPLGKTTRVNLHSAWPDPSFGGAFLPISQDIRKSGFDASWLVTHLNRNYPQAWLNDEFSFRDSSFNAGLFLPVNHYQKAERSLKYAIMFIALTFLLFLLIEILNRKRLHPIQYFLVGMAISVFYILLVSLSEQMPFALAYLLSSLAVTCLITFYIHGNYQDKSVTITTLIILLILYSFLFILLQLQDYSLLFGSIGLFIVIGTCMYLTRKVNWYKEESREDE